MLSNLFRFMRVCPLVPFSITFTTYRQARTVDYMNLYVSKLMSKGTTLRRYNSAHNMVIHSEATLNARLILVVVMLTLTTEVASLGATPILYARGSHYQVGEQMGLASKNQIQDAIHGKALKDLMEFNETTRGQQLYSSLLVAAETHYTQYVDELRGLAAGAGVPFNKIFLMNLLPEINIVRMQTVPEVDKDQPSGGCSNFMINNKEWALHAHAEDAPPEVRYNGSIWAIEVTDKDEQVIESLIGYAYPGMSPGSAWTLNSHAVMFGGNIVTPQTLSPVGAVPRRLANRYLLTCTSINDCIARIEKLPDIGSGMNYMLSERSCAENNPDCILQLGIELVNSGVSRNMVHVHLAADFDSHFNEYEHLPVDQHPDPSSKFRHDRLEEYKLQQGGPLTNFRQLTEIISDQQNADFPFYRDGAPPDYLATDSIAIADWYHNKLYIYKDKPTQAAPEVTFDLRPWNGTPLNVEERMVDPEPFTQPPKMEEAPIGKSKDEL